MHDRYPNVVTRFLSNEERLITSEENEMPLVIEANNFKDIEFLQTLMKSHSQKITEDIAKYGAVLLRGFDINSEEDFENTVLSIKGFKGISEAFMSEEGRIHVNDLKYVLHTNGVYNTGGTVYLGGFHSENYYTPDVPAYISFCCFHPSLRGGETGLINMEKIYACLDSKLKEKLEKNTFFVSKWLVSEVADRYNISTESVEKICHHFNLPLLGEGKEKFILMYKPSIFNHPLTNTPSLQINLFELPELNVEMRKCFMADYKGKVWFWHRFFWRLPAFILKTLEFIYIIFSSFFYSPIDSLRLLLSKWRTSRAANNLPKFNDTRVGSCFDKKEIKNLAHLIRNYYSSCLWKKGDILLIDNRKVMHAGMPGCGPRRIRALIANPMVISYSFGEKGDIDCQDRNEESIGFYANSERHITSMNEKKSFKGI